MASRIGYQRPCSWQPTGPSERSESNNGPHHAVECRLLFNQQSWGGDAFGSESGSPVGPVSGMEVVAWRSSFSHQPTTGSKSTNPPQRPERSQDHQLRTTEARTEAEHVQSPGERALSPASWKELFAPPFSLSTEERPWLCGSRGQTAACAPPSETFGGQKPSMRTTFCPIGRLNRRLYYVMSLIFDSIVT
jgi:hypothetical protein